MRTTTKSLSFPLAGVSRRGPYRQQTRPFSAPWAVNVRTAGPSEHRLRGGSRPGLAKLCSSDLGDLRVLVPVTYYDSNATLQHDLVYVGGGAVGTIRAGTATAATAILTDENGDPITSGLVTFEWATTVSTGALQAAVRAGRVYLADTTLKVFDPSTGAVEPVLASAGTVPTGQPLVAAYRDRIFVGGANQLWFCSRIGDPGDWDFGQAKEDTGRAWVGQLSDAGLIGDVLTAMVPVHDRYLVMATSTSLWVLQGDPTTGSFRNVSMEVGILAPNAWAMDPEGQIAFLSNDGAYLYRPGGALERFSAERTPDELREVDTSTNTISMTHDPEWRGFHLFVTPSAGTGTHFFLDVEHKAFWPQRLASGHQPLEAALLDRDGLGTAVLASQDGYVRYFADGQVDDDGSDLYSHVLIGPVRLSPDDVRDGMLAELHGVLDEVSSDNDGTVTWRVILGKSASEAAESALGELNTYLAGGTPTVDGSGTWAGGRNRVVRPRVRGAWAVVWLSSRESWSYEVVAMVGRQLGRHR